MAHKKGEDVGTRIRNVVDLLAGLMFFGFGTAAVVLGRDYPMGSAMRMGPGYFPTILGGLLILLGLAVWVRGLLASGGAPPSFRFKPLLLVLVSISLFALSVERLGIVVAVTLVVLVSALAAERFRWRELLTLTLIMVALAVGVFTKGLGLPFRLAPF